MRNGTQAGFSLLELLITVAVILIIAAIAVPHFIAAKMAANEGSAVASMRSVTSALIVYVTTYPAVGYPASLSDLGDGGNPANCIPAIIPTPVSACLIDPTLAAGPKSGYVFTYVSDGAHVPSAGYGLNADPVSRGNTGRRSFFTDVPGVIHWNANAPATDADPSIPM